MNDGWVLWLVLVGLAIGLATGWLLLVRLPREESDVDAAERRAEAQWIGSVIERYGGIAPVPLVEEVLELHQAYLADPRLAQRPSEGYPGAAAPPPGSNAGRPPAGPPLTGPPPMVPPPPGSPWMGPPLGAPPQRRPAAPLAGPPERPGRSERGPTAR